LGNTKIVERGMTADYSACKTTNDRKVKNVERNYAGKKGEIGTARGTATAKKLLHQLQETLDLSEKIIPVYPLPSR